MKKIITVQKTKYFWLYYIFAFIFVAAFVFLAPFWGGVNVFWKDWGSKIIYIIMALFLTLYLVFFLLKQVRKRTKAVVYTLSLVEFILLAILDVLCVVSEFVPVLDSFFTCSRVLGIALFLRGLVGCFHGYFYNTTDEHKYPLWQFCVDIVLLSLGVFFMATNIISNQMVLWIFVSILLILGILCLTLAILTQPASKKKEKKQVKNESNTSSVNNTSSTSSVNNETTLNNDTNENKEVKEKKEKKEKKQKKQKKSKNKDSKKEETGESK